MSLLILFIKIYLCLDFPFNGFRQVHALGTTFDMVYGEWVGVGESREDSPIVLCVHGIPATEGAFRPIGSNIAAHGYRVIAVNSPGKWLYISPVITI